MTAPHLASDAPVSVLTLARGRDKHLRNVILGLAQQTRQPAELIIGVMQNDLYTDLPDTDFPVRQVLIEGGRPAAGPGPQFCRGQSCGRDADLPRR
ncbi:hypothetical protein [Loktanella sp. M215]|uniref:hypothetical protein n=1 Tax=Loktanella sp. M215 TaxID=2675431 RepID=UPI001F29A8F3|nr:hypothetical protein [Loktanella sp. M215]